MSLEGQARCLSKNEMKSPRLLAVVEVWHDFMCDFERFHWIFRGEWHGEGANWIQKYSRGYL